MRIIFFTQTAIGLIGNSSLFCLYSFTSLTGHHLRPTDLILNQLVLANFMVIFSKGVPQTMTTFGWNYFWDDIRCKLVFYFYRVGTGVSFNTVCLFNGFQVIKLNPRICRCLEFKIRSLKFIGFCCLLCWILHLMINSFIPLVVSGPLNKTNFSVVSNHGSCSWTMQGRYTSLYTFLYFTPDMVSLSFMAWASGSMILLLHRHKQRVQHICSHRLSPRYSHEARATHTILILMSSFVSFYSVYIVLTFWSVLVTSQGQWIVNSSVLLASCFPAFSPFALIISDPRVSRFCFASQLRKNIFS